MQYNEKYDRYVTKGGLVYRYDSKQDKLVLCKLSNSHNYKIVTCQQPKKGNVVFIHRLVYETFVGEIPQGYEIDHIDGDKQNNDLSNLRCVNHADNMANPVTKVRMRVPKSEFGRKFYEHYGITMYEDSKLYDKESHWYRKHNNTCRWEKEA